MASSQSLSARVMKAMGVFGGTQVVNILCSVVRTKLVAVWIGAAGVGLFGVFNSAIDMISQLSMMGIGTSGTRDIAGAKSDNDRRRTISIVRRWSLWLGVLGMVLTLLLAPVLSMWSFGDTNHAGAFRLLSIVVLFFCLANGEQAVLQGLRRLRRLAKSSILGVLMGLIVSIPLFYYLRLDSIIPSIIVCSVTTLVSVMIFRERCGAPKPRVGRAETISGGRSLISLGFFITLSLFISLLASYLLMGWLNKSYGTAMAGYFQAGFTLINRYVGLVLAALGVEYFPRLASVDGRRFLTKVFVSFETKVTLAVLVPVIGAFIVASPLIIRLLYVSEFEVILPFVQIGILGTIFRCISWCMAFVILARGDGRIYIITESVSAVSYILINVFAMTHFGISGMGYAYFAWYLIYVVLVAAVYYFRYGLRLSRGILLLSVYSLATVVAIYIANSYVGLWLSIPITVAAGVFSLSLLRRKRRLAAKS